MALQNINYTTNALKEVQENLKFTNPTNSLIEYYYLQRVNNLKDDTNNRLLIGVNTTLLADN